MFDDVIGGFARLVVSGFVIWMALVLLLFFKELFTPGDINVRDYLFRAWKRFLLSFEVTAYGGVFVAPYMMKNSEQTAQYTAMLIFAILFSALFLYLRFQSGGFKLRRRQR
ncbi:hypothetical protein [Melghirimyces algeriensis]|uniref:Uncharacterized protein n=1 Tax=Melghirimyces algeriensis TaxID=910412 RepID=A0A521CTQ6_9BACL|nr:hypothetical protein [Melghirimyces algeriensis]SMO62813.1 hypothetical protein SAMN06264849_104173 [Melghirimyces algeriensis]